MPEFEGIMQTNRQFHVLKSLCDFYLARSYVGIYYNFLCSIALKFNIEIRFKKMWFIIFFLSKWDTIIEHSWRENPKLKNYCKYQQTSRIAITVDGEVVNSKTIVWKFHLSWEFFFIFIFWVFGVLFYSVFNLHLVKCSNIRSKKQAIKQYFGTIVFITWAQTKRTNERTNTSKRRGENPIIIVF